MVNVETAHQECKKKDHAVTKYPIQYLNRNGKPIVLTLTNHARWRFITRWKLAFPEKPLAEESVDKEIAMMFSKANRVQNLSRHDRKRLDKHGGDTLFFRTSKFTFVVQNSVIVTIEISDKDERHLNKKPIHHILRGSTKQTIIQKPQPIPVEKPQQIPTEKPQPISVEKPQQITDQKKTNEDLPRFKLTASATTDNGQYRFVNLGSYDSKMSNGDPQTLRFNRVFSEEMKLKFHEKQPTWIMRAIYATLGRNGDPVKVYDENDDMIHDIQVEQENI